MPRLRLDLPERILHTVELTVRVTDLNYGNHLGNNALLGLLHEARLQWFRAMGHTDERNLGGAGIILADAAIVFQSEAFLGEELLIELRVGEVSRAAFDLYYVVKSKKDLRQVARAKTGVVFFDYETRRTAPMPAAFRAVITEEK
ncbi:Acyl-CoA thioesterase FadM [Formivibrio citricus]|uniref:Acyl-CoA thioesterase FadM n=1 Tax=Formivibrio citricus TaxID=83765 RepID=A0A1I4X829_9NEIS|nr:thioesterase family protein [Formivibrio citricus]SFN21703.1 Acyl-CoA thioesterase FadM [Formivibrio citricus]